MDWSPGQGTGPDANQEWLGTEARPSRTRTRLIVGAALAASLAAAGLHLATDGSPSPSRPDPVVHGGNSVRPNEPLLDRCALRVSSTSRDRCFHEARVTPEPFDPALLRRR